MYFTDDEGRHINLQPDNILHWRGEKGGLYMSSRNARVEPYVFLTLVDGSEATLRKEEATRFLEQMTKESL